MPAAPGHLEADRLAADEIQVWCLAPDDLPAHAAEALSAEERAAVERLAFPRDRALRRAAWALLRHALAVAAGGTPAGWRFERGPWGKPRLAAGQEGPVFNLTHTPGLVACALAAAGDLGVDAEHDRDGAAPLDLAPRVFLPAEQALLAGAAAPAATFFALWTLKEAVMKATGLGAGLAPQRLNARLTPPGCEGQPGPGPWRFASLAPTPRHRLAVALGGAPGVARLRWRRLARWDAAGWQGRWHRLPLH